MSDQPGPNQQAGASSALIVILSIAVIGLVAVIVFLLLGNRSPTPAPEPTELPPIELPENLPSGPSATALEAVNVRSGPGTDFPSYGIAAAGSSGEVIGVSPDGGWWAIKIPTNIVSSGQGWVSADFVQTDNLGDVPIIEPPPLP